MTAAAVGHRHPDARLSAGHCLRRTREIQIENVAESIPGEVRLLSRRATFVGVVPRTTVRRGAELN